MAELDDHQLLAQFTRDNSETAFAALVERHIGLVYAVALRSVGNAHAAEEITQAVFIILTRKAEELSAKIILSGWLYQTTRLTAANFLRTEIRRQHREQEAYMQSQLETTADLSRPSEAAAETWTRIAPLLDDALDKLGTRDRDALALRFFENKSMAEIGAALGASEDAAKVRVSRALEKLRKIFTKRGVTLSAAAIVGAASANAASAAPVGLAKTISAVAITKGAAAGGSTLALVKGAMKLMAWTKMKMAVAVTAGVLLAAGTTTMAVKKIVHQKEPVIPEQMWMADYSTIKKLPPVLVLRSSKFVENQGGINLDDRYVWRNMQLDLIFDIAYPSLGAARTLHADLIPASHWDFSDIQKRSAAQLTNGYDLMLTLTNKPIEKLQQEIQKQFGLFVRREMIETNVLLLKMVRTDAPGIKPGQGHGYPMDVGGLIFYQHGYSITNTDSLGHLAGQIEDEFNLPVLDRTGVKGYFDVSMSWKLDSANTIALAQESPAAKNLERELITKALLEQLGLELVPAREKVEMLIVERAK